jgi:D-sedoheptulose 7-phosphate isomerase|tara:strand:- start:1934 stop:2512 length:579 start_codon:yes stop_codon:yes gene_type:complete
MEKQKPLKLLSKEIKGISTLLNNLQNINLKHFDTLCLHALRAVKKGKKIIFFGNGGSASDAQHLAAELVCKYKKKRKAIAGISLSTDTSIITSIGNDIDFKYIFSRQIEAIGNQGDIAIAITTSGNSKNLIEAVKSANKKKITTFCLSGNNGGKVKKYVKFPVLIPSKVTSQIQVAEILIGQTFCEFLEENC